MKKKVILFLFALILTMFSAACGENPADSSSEGGEQTEPTVTHTHTFASEWTNDETYHWHIATCEHTNEISGKTEHTWVDTTDKDTPATETSIGKDYKKCSVCGYETYIEIPMLKQYVRLDAEGNTTNDGQYILFGTYPQTSVTDETTLATLNTKVSETKPTNSDAQGFTSYKYYIQLSNTTDFMWYKDIDIDSNGTYDYRCVYFDQYRPCETSYISSTDASYQDDNGYTTGNYYFFKYESIKWRILKEADGKATILAELILDSQDYNYAGKTQVVNGKAKYANNYEYSTIRKWLNESFYNTAFTELQKSIINTVEVDNSASTTESNSNSHACSNTFDKVWLLSYQDVYNTEYGFESSYERQKKTTDYAQCQGVYTSNEGEYSGNGYYWLRSPDYNERLYSLYIFEYGVWRADCVNYTNGGIVPIIEITL